MRLLPLLFLASVVRASSVTNCHTSGDEIHCVNEDGHEVQVILTATPTGEPPAQYTDCHTHGSEEYCVDPEGNDVQIIEEEEDSTHEHDHDHDSASSEEEGEEEQDQELDCHFHAGVEHCVGAGEEEHESSTASCGIQTRDYDISLRIGTLFVVLVTSAIGVFLPLGMVKLPFKSFNTWVSIIIKQFGTGVIISTAFIHLYTHANLMFTNECLGELEYESTTSAVVMAGIFLSFLTEYIGHRIILARSSSPSSSPSPQPTESGVGAIKPSAEQPETQQHLTLAQLGHHHGSPLDPTNPNTKLSVLVMEAGIIFHSILIGLTLVVAGDSFYRTLLVVIIFHQFFEALALGARIALLPSRFFPTKAIMALTFALITPIGMAIGLGVLHSFNGNERNTLIALGTLDALSAGILVWVGVVDMWARDWVIDGGDMMNAPALQVLVGGVSLIVGMALMGLLGKWA